jgi:hypothetical protein
VPAGGAIHSALGRFRASCSPALRPVRGVLPLDWDRRLRVTPAEPTSQEAWPGAEPLGPTSLWREPRWNADRRARSHQRVAAPVTRRGGCYPAPVGVSLPSFFPASEEDQQGRNSWLRWPALAMTRMRMHRGNGIARNDGMRGKKPGPWWCRPGHLPARFLLVLRRASARLERRRTGT